MTVIPTSRSSWRSMRAAASAAKPVPMMAMCFKS
jgi:hypothetical protein